MIGGDSRPARRASDAGLVWNVSGLLGEGPTAIRDYAIEGVSIELGDELRLANPIDGRVHLSRTNRGLLIDADVTTALATECARCLREIVVPLAVEIQEEALPSIDLHSGQAVAPSAQDEEDGVLRLSAHHELDLEPTVREAILLAEPIAPLCREDCPGLCISCGLPLEEGRHDHPADDIDPRLDALRAFQPD